MEKPIMFSAPMVNAILQGRKTQTRRIVKPQPTTEPIFQWDGKKGGFVGLQSTNTDMGLEGMAHYCPHGVPGDSLWVRENFRFGFGYDDVKPRDVPKEQHIRIWYEADGEPQHGFGKLRPSIFLPRYFTRTLLDIKGIRVERLNDISEDDARAEGVPENMTYVPVQVDLPNKPTLQQIERSVNPPMKQCWRTGFQRLWQSLNGNESWNANPYVWVIEFQRKG